MRYEDRLSIQTPEGVEVEVTLAGLGSRITAGLVDALIQGVTLGALSVLFFAFFDGGWDQGPFILIAFLNLAFFLVFFFYYVFFEALWSGLTPGKRAAGLRVVRTGGQPVGFKASAIRNIMRLVDVLPSTYGVGIISILVTSRNQRIGDLVAGTVVIRDPSPRRKKSDVRAAREFDPAELAAWDTTGITVDELVAVRRYLQRREALPQQARADLARDLAAKLRSRVPGSERETEPETFLEKLAAAKAAKS